MGPYNLSESGLVLLVAFVAVLCLPLTACDVHPAESDVPVKVGVIGPFTGVAAFYGQYMREGIDLALEDFNKAGGIGGRNITFVYEDDKCIDLKSVPVILEKFKSVDEVAGAIGPFCSTPILIAAKFAQEEGMVMVTPGDNLGKKSDYAFSTRYLLSDEADAIAGYSITQGKKRVALLYLDSDWGRSYKEAILAFLNENGGDLVDAEPYTYDNLDVRSQLAKIKEARPDSLVVIDGTGGDLFKQVREIGFDILILSEWQIEKDSSGVAPDHLEGVVYFRPPDSSTQEFRERFMGRYGHAPNVIMVDSYDAAMVLFDGLKECSGKGSDCVASRISGLKDWPGAQGELTFDQGRWDFKKRLVPKVVKGGRFVSLV